MSCPDFVISEKGRAAIGVGQGMIAGDYPLVSPSDDVAGLIADMHLAYDDKDIYEGKPPKKEPLRIKYLTGLGCLQPMAGVPNGRHGADIQIVDADDKIVFDSFAGDGVVYTKTDWSSDYDIHEWRDDMAVCRIVVYTTWPRTDVNDTDTTVARNYASKIAPASAVINARAVYKMPKRLLSLQVKTAGATTDKAKGQIVFKNGYNTEIAVGAPTSSNFRTTTRITFSGVAGTGLGRFFNCAESDVAPVITTINGIAPTPAGDFLMGGKDCLWSTHPVIATPPPENNQAGNPPADNEPTPLIKLDGAAGIKFGGDCKACCSCEDYVAAAEYMNQVAYRYQLIGQRAQEVYTQHETNVANWTARSCGVGETMKMVATSQECGAIDVAITFCNTCSACIPASTLTLDMYVPEPPDEPVPIDPQFIFTSHQQSKNVNGNQLIHDVDCSYTKISGASVDTAVSVTGSFATQFRITGLIDANGNSLDEVRGEMPAFPQIKPKSLVWPTFVPNVFTADTPTTEMLYDRGADDMICNADKYEQLWETSKNDPTWGWRGSAFSGRGPREPRQALNVYGIRIEDNDPLPVTPLANTVGSYLRAKYVPQNDGINFVNWSDVGEMRVESLPGGDVVVSPANHDRWWSPIGGVAFGTEQVDGKKEVRTHEMINEGQIGAIISSPAGVTALAERLDIAAGPVINDVFIGVLSNEFASDVVPTAGMSIADKFGLFSSWSPVGVNGFWPATVETVYVETIRTSNNNSIPPVKILWLRIKRPQAPNTTFPQITIDFSKTTDDSGTTTVAKTAHASVFKTIRLYNMNMFNEHVKLATVGGDPVRGKGFAAPWTVIDKFNGIRSATNTTAVDAPIYSKPDRYIAAKTPRRISISTPDVSPGSTIQIDFRVTLRELRLLAYASQYTSENWAMCDDDAPQLKFCDDSDFSAGAMALHPDAERMHIISGNWSPPEPGKDGVFYTYAQGSAGSGITHQNGLTTCGPVFARCGSIFVPKYWTLLRWTKTHDAVYLNSELLSAAEYKEEYACEGDGLYNGYVEITPEPVTNTNNPPKSRVKVCAYKMVSDKLLTKRKVTPRGPYSIDLVLTGKKPTGSTADLTKQHILDNACEGDLTAKKAFIKENVKLQCDTDGRTPSC